MKVLICGGRDMEDKDLVYKTLAPYYEEYKDELEIVSGMAKGADHWGYLFSFHYDLKCHKFPANWDKYGKSAGPRRNKQMLDETPGGVDLVIAFPTKNSRGTWHMVQLAREYGIKTVVIE